MIGFRLSTGAQIELAPDATISLEINNALLADVDNNGSYTLPVTAPRSATNEQVLAFAGLLDSPAGARRRIENVSAFDDDELLAVGTLLLLRVTATAFELSLTTGTSAVMARLKGRKLRSFAFGGQRTVATTATANNYLMFAVHMNTVMANPAQYDYVFAPISNNDFLADNSDGWPRRANFNNYSLGPVAGFGCSSGVFPVGTIVPGLSPSIYPGLRPEYQMSCVPFPRLAYVVRTLLHEMSIPFEEDFFDAETEQLVIIGNTAIDDPRANSEASTLDVTQVGLTFRIGDVLPDISAHELLRAVADTYFLDLSASPLGVLRIRRTKVLLSAPPAVSLTAQATPSYSVNVPPEEPPGLTMAYRIDKDAYAAAHYQKVDPLMRGEDAATVANLPAQPAFEHEIRLVVDTQYFYQHDGTAWVKYSVSLPTVTVGPEAGAATEVLQGTDLIVEEEAQTDYQLPAPGAVWPPVGGTQPAFAVMRIGAFGERGYSPSYNALTRSTAVRLGFYRGMQPYMDAAQGSYPMLSQINYNLQGARLGNYTLRVDGPDGTVARFGQELLEARHAAAEPVTWPVWLTAEQINQLDMGRRVEIDGIHFLVLRINVTFPIRKPAELQLVVLRPKANLS